MKLRIRSSLLTAWLLGTFIGIATHGASAQTTSTSSSTEQQAPPSQTTSATQLDLSDPKVRDRLRATGIDPDDLERLLQASEGGAPVIGAAPGNATVTEAPAYPPVQPPTGAQPAKPDTAAKTAVEPDSSGAKVRYFGYEIFSLKPTTFEPLTFGPVSPDYLLGPGDEVIVSVWGAQELNARATINREGFLVLPDVGEVPANGYTLAGFKQQLEKRLARIYSGIGRDGGGRTWVDVSLGKLRSLQVFVLGEVVQPGGYTVSATSTILNALYYSGGPTTRGSLRQVRVLRNSQLIHQADLYGYLALGDRSQDFKLENGDVVFVPSVSRRVTLEGEVNRPAVYELKEGETLANLLEIAGGMTSNALRTRVQIERIVPFQERQPMDPTDRRVMDLDMADSGSEVELQDGDIVRIFRTRDILRNTVRIVGTAVYKPGTYEHRPGMTVADLVERAGGLLGDAYTKWAHLVRTREDKSRELRSFNLEAAMRRDPGANLVLEQRDEVQVFAVEDIRDPEHVSIQGLVRRPGTYELLEGMTVTDLIVKAGGLKESAYRLRAEISRIDPEKVPDGRSADVLYASLGDSTNTGSEASNFVLRKNDIVFVREIPNWSLQENVWITGEVKFPGMYSLQTKTDRLSSVIERAGGLESTAYLQAAKFFRKKDDTGRMAIDFQKALNGKGKNRSVYDLVLAAGDSIHIPREPKAVKVTGAVGFPSSVLWEKGREMNYYIEQAGGLLAAADRDKITVVMANGRVERSRFMHTPKPDAGATIRVPEKPEQKDRETLKNLTQIITILTGAATTVYLISQASN